MNESGIMEDISAETVPFGDRVYFIRGGDEIKIGYSNAVTRRLRELQVSRGERLELLGTIWGGYETEQALHRHFRELNIDGEWFRPEQALLDFIEANKLAAGFEEWTGRANSFAKRRREEMKGADSSEIMAGSYLGCAMHRLARAGKPLLPEFKKLGAAFEGARHAST